MDDRRLQLDRDGAEHVPGFFTPAALRELEQILPGHAINGGVRIFGAAALAKWLDGSAIPDLVSSTIARRLRAVRAIFFDKTIETNWALGWHQDRTIAVRERHEHPGFDHWTIKSGVQHVEPPFPIIEKLLTARIHLDPVTDGNSPLLIAPGSHRFGRIREADIESVVTECGSTPCLAEAGDVWLYRTAILHASEKSKGTGRRRVLQVDFSADELPGGLQWLGIADGCSRSATVSS